MNSQLFIKTRPLVRAFHSGASLSTSKPNALVDSIIRVDHAGELGADRIYAGQMAVLGHTQAGPLIQHMWDQEKFHKETFEKLIVKHRVRPTALVPIWNVAGFLLGAGTALMGEKAAMACTVAVESVIVEHYNDQLRTLMSDPEKNKELMETIQKFRDDEQEHHDVGIDHGAEQAPFYKALSEVIKFGCRTAIAMSKGLFSNQIQSNLTFARTYCTSSYKSLKWDIYSTVCLERKPVILKPLTELEKKVVNIFNEIEYENSYKSNHEVKREDDMAKIQKLKNDKSKSTKTKTIDQILGPTAHEFEELSDRELASFQAAPRTTEADAANDTRSTNRKLSSHLTLLLNEKHDVNNFWFFPNSLWKEPETLRETAERSLREIFDDNMKVQVLGNAPWGYIKINYPKGSEISSRGAKIFFYKALYISGNIKLANNIVDYYWATRSEMYKLIHKRYHKKLSKILIDDDDKEEEEKITELKEAVN